MRPRDEHDQRPTPSLDDLRRQRSHVGDSNPVLRARLEQAIAALEMAAKYEQRAAAILADLS